MTTLAGNIQTQDYGYAVVVPQGTWRWVTRVNVSQSLPFFSIHNIVTPFGLLRDSVPIPGNVVTAMAQSISDLQSAFAPLIVLSPTSLTFSITEGSGFGQPQNVIVTNGGVYGSLLAATVSSNASYVTVNPANVSSLAFNVSGQFAVMVDSTDLQAIDSPYSATITVQDSNATNSPQTIPVTINVLPLATISLTPTSLSFAVNGTQGTPYPTIPSQTFQVLNTGLSGSVLNYQIQKLIGNSPWLVSFSPTYGTINGGSGATITVVVQPPQWMQPGTYTEILRVSGYSSNSYQDLQVTFTIQ